MRSQAQKTLDRMKAASPDSDHGQSLTALRETVRLIRLVTDEDAALRALIEMQTRWYFHGYRRGTRGGMARMFDLAGHADHLVGRFRTWLAGKRS